MDWSPANDVRIFGKWQWRNELFYERSDLKNGKNQHKARKSIIVQYQKQAGEIRSCRANVSKRITKKWGRIHEIYK